MVPTPSRGTRDSEPLTHLASNDDDSNWKEVMSIQITVYSLNGILRSEIQPKSPAKQHRRRRLPSESDEKAAISALSCQTKDVPTTAFVAIAHEKVQTYLPSMPLTIHEDAARYSAYWRDDGCSGLKGFGDCDKEPCTTFEISRVMKREPFRPETKIGQVSHYICERIDLNITVGKGKDMVPLGIASIVVSGDDDGEVLLNVPVKPQVSLDGSKSVNNGAQYSLLDNASLRIGTRVFPQHMKERMRTKSDFYIDCESDEDECSQVIAIEIDEENSTIARLLLNKGDGALGSELGKKFTDEGYRIDSPIKTPIIQGFKGFFCGTIPSCIARE